MRWAAIILLSGCSSILGIEDFKLGDAGGNPIDGNRGYCLGPQGFEVCLEAEPTEMKAITTMISFDTSNPGMVCASTQPASWKAAGQPDACFIIGQNVMIDAPAVQATGARPLVIFAADTITIRTLDVASHTTSRGAASNSSSCTAASTGAGGNTTGGGGGGSFMTRGGNGGQSNGGIAGGVAANNDSGAPMLLRGGCGGGPGQQNTAGSIGGPAGAGGGAVYLVAGEKITINGFINASGAPGSGGGTGGTGGGGGGSGGMILLHAPVINGSGGVLIANGGGGGGGGGGNNAGTSGNEPAPQNPTQAAAGGPGAPSAGAGGAGFPAVGNALTGSSGAAGGPAAGGGGGGGASGYIRSNVDLSLQLTTSPPVTVVR